MAYRSIEMNLRVGCPIRCNFCPQSTFLNSDCGTKKVLSAEDFRVILDNASYQNAPIEVYFAGMSEPLAIPNWFELCQIAQSHPLVTYFSIFTTGYKITVEQIKALGQLNKLYLNVHVGDRQDMPGFDEEIWDKLWAIKKYIPLVHFEEVAFDVSKFTEINKKLDQHGLKYHFQPIISRAGNLESVGQVQLSHKKSNCAVTCDKVHEKKRPVILPDGTALACCNDYGCELKIGNLLHQKWDELDYKKIIAMQKNADSELPCFRDCHLAVKDKSLTSKSLDLLNSWLVRTKNRLSTSIQ